MMDLINELNLPNTQHMRESIEKLKEKYSEKEIAEAINFAQINGRNDFAYVESLLKVLPTDHSLVQEKKVW